ncbi:MULTISPECIES: PadR family transcriptional regulator [Comamonas]|uniref:PadR family transcriptional regulator n=1 Tax=Comamonas thiooxydans TaxID=363952 RepID=UPI002114D8A7|nr:PadR family transcriptional regulator [Comamonas thiooxydans]UUE94509.1 PadR family transcriptional regulator [Comamonas thiooxydans]
MMKLTSTAYALLGLLARRSWSAYELTKHMQISVVTAFNSRAPSHLYAEIKKLEKHGLADVSEDFHGKRKRQVYTITEAGRSALEAWLLGGETTPATNDWETMLRLLFQDQGSPEGIADSLARMEDEVLHYLRGAVEGVGQILAEDRIEPHSLFVANAVELLVSTQEMHLTWVRNFRELAKRLPALSESETRSQARASYLRSHRRMITLLTEMAE